LVDDVVDERGPGEGEPRDVGAPLGRARERAGAVDPDGRRGAEEPLVGPLEVGLGGEDQEREVPSGERARDIAVGVHRVVDHERGPLGDARLRARRGDKARGDAKAARGAQHLIERPEAQDEQLDDVPREPLGARLGTVDPLGAEELLGQPGLLDVLGPLALRKVGVVEGGPVDRAQGVGGVLDGVARDRVHLEALVAAPQVGVLGVPHLGGVQELAREPQPLLLERLPRKIGAEEEEEVDVDAVHEEGAPRRAPGHDGADEGDPLRPGKGLGPLGEGPARPGHAIEQFGARSDAGPDLRLERPGVGSAR
jgi:hypothetical protein